MNWMSYTAWQNGFINWISGMQACTPACELYYVGQGLSLIKDSWNEMLFHDNFHVWWQEYNHDYENITDYISQQALDQK